MKKPTLILRLLTLLFLVPGCTPPPAATSVRPAARQAAVPLKLVTSDAARPEWGPQYVLADSSAVLHLAPKIGRIMHLSRPGEANLLWVSDDLVRDGFGGWIGFGGEKLWPWPQRPVWIWPPPAGVDTGPYRCESLVDGRNGVQLAGPVDPLTGLAASRQTWLVDGGVASRYTLERRAVGTKASAGDPVAAWTVAQIPPVDAVYVRLLPGPAVEPVRGMSPASAETLRLNDRWIKVVPHYAGAKVGLCGDLIAVPIRDRLLVMERTAGNDDPNLDRAHSAQVYFHRQPAGGGVDSSVFTEIELLGVSRVLAEGESCSLDVRWRILRADQLPELIDDQSRSTARR